MHLLSELIRFLSTRPCKPSAYLDRGPSSAIRVIWLLWASSISPKGPMEQSKERPPVLPSGGRAKPGRQLRQWTLHPGPRPARPATLRPVPACGAGSHGAEASPTPAPAGWLLSSAPPSECQAAKSWPPPAQSRHLALEQVPTPQGGSGGEQKPALRVPARLSLSS